MKFIYNLILSFVFSQVIFCGMVFATVEQPTGDGFGSVRVVTEEGGINLSGTEKDQDTNIIDAIKGFINWTLGILGLIAMIMLLYGGFVMLTAVGNERYGSGFTIVKNALLGLVVIGLAWFVASAIFWITNLITEESVGTDAGTTSIIMPYLR